MHCSETWITLSFTSISTFCWHLYLTKNLSGTLFSGVNRFQAGKTNQKVSHLVQYLCTWITRTCLRIKFNFILVLNFISLCFWAWLCVIMSLKQKEIKFTPRIKLNHNMYNDRCITGMCIHVITVTSDRPWTQHQGLQGHIPFIPCILVNTAQECEHIEKKSGHKVKRVSLTKNGWRAPFVIRNKKRFLWYPA